MAELIRTQAEAQVASAHELDAALAAYTGERRRPGECDAVMRVRVCMALLSAEDAHGHLGVSKGTLRPQPLTITERNDIMDKARTNYPEGTVAAELKKQRRAEPTEDQKAPAPRAKIEKVRATGEGTSKLQSTSVRAAILSHIPSTEAGITVEALDAICGRNTRPHLQKLLEKNHIEVL